MKIAHISDLHCDATKRSKTIIRNLFKSISKKKIDHLIVTGDLTISGHDAEFAVISDIFNEFGWTISDKLTVIPGNHDLFPELFGEKDWEEEIENVEYKKLPSLIMSAFNVLHKYKGYSKDNYYYSINSFLREYSYSLDNTLNFGSKAYPFPFIKIIDENIALICLDSNKVYPTIDMSARDLIETFKRMFWGDKDWIDEALEYSDNPICCNGWLELKQIRKVFKDPILRGKKKIVLLHHYLYDLDEVQEYQEAHFAYFMQIFSQSLEPFIQQLKSSKVDLVLHGHWHITEKYSLNNIPILNSGDSLHDGWFQISSDTSKLRVTKINT